MASTRQIIRRGLWAVAALVFIAIAVFACMSWLAEREPHVPSVAVSNGAAQVERGRYLALAGNCAACHTARGGAPYAGGREMATPFGGVYSSNLTPDATGLGQWSSDDFWRALHHGKSKDGRRLYPAFPYTNYTKVTRADADALFAYLRSVPPVNQPNIAHTLRFPYDQQASLLAWRALYFRPGEFVPESARDAQFNRGAYLVQGLGHCNACHTARDPLGGSKTRADLAGGLIPVLNWYAHPLNPPAGGTRSAAHLERLLSTGISEQGAVYGPMAEVVYKSLQHLNKEDIAAIAGYLNALPPAPASEPPAKVDVADMARVMEAGARLYKKHCADCHGADGKGAGSDYPPLAGNPSLLMPSAVNPIRLVLNGGYPPGTAGNPRPYGMPPFRLALSMEEVAVVLSYTRNAWSNKADLVYPVDVERFAAVPLE